MHIETLAVHAGRHVDTGTGAVMSPIYLSTTYERNADGTYPHGYVYTRTENPNRRALEECMVRLEGGSAAAAFASGQAATACIFQALSPGDHVIVPDDTYFGTGELARNIFAPWGLDVSVVDMTVMEQVADTLRPNSRLVWVETPSNPLLKITDIAAVAQMAHKVGAVCVVDNTWPSPIGQSPLQLGADLVMHATTKYLGGHSDLLGGVVVSRLEDDVFGRIRSIQTSGGAVPSPFDCWLLLRSISTLPYRMRAHSESAMRIARFLEECPRVEVVHYPGLENHPGHEIAARQMTQYGGMLSIQIAGSAADAMAVAGKVQLFTRATSLGGVESLIEHRASVERQSRTPQNLLRISVGLENTEDLIGDLSQALA